MVRAVSTTTTAPICWRRSRRQTSTPSRSGSPRSSKTRSNSAAVAAARPAWPVRRRQEPSQQTGAVGSDSDPTDLDPETRRLVRLGVPAGQGGGGEGTRPCTAGRLRRGGRCAGRGGLGFVDGYGFFVRRGASWRLRWGRLGGLGGLGDWGVRLSAD